MKEKHIQMYMRIAEAAALTSSGVRLQVGCCVVKNDSVLAVSYNGLPKSIDGPLEEKVYMKGGAGAWLDIDYIEEEWPLQDELGRYKLVTRKETNHSERNAILSLARGNESSVGATMFITHASCPRCSIDIVDAGISTVYYRNEYRDISGIQYLIDNGVTVHKI